MRISYKLTAAKQNKSQISLMGFADSAFPYDFFTDANKSIRLINKKVRRDRAGESRDSIQQGRNL